MAFLAVLSEELLQLLLNKLLNKLHLLYKSNIISSKMIVNYLRNFIKENRKYIDDKTPIYLMPKVNKDF